MAQGLRQQRFNLQTAAHGFPGLLTLQWIWRLAIAFLAPDLLQFVNVVGFLAVPLLTVALGTGLSVGSAWIVAIRRFWAQPLRWIGIGLLGAVALLLFAAGWGLVGRPLWLAFLIYPGFASILVGTAVALFLGEDVQIAIAGPTSRSWAWVLPSTVVGMACGTLLLQQWSAYWPSPEAAIEARDEGYSGFPYGLQRYVILTQVAHDDREWVLYREEFGPDLAVAELESSRYGWRVHSTGQHSFPERQSNEPPGRAKLSVQPLASGDSLIWGEFYDPQIRSLRTEGTLVPIGNWGGLVLLPIKGSVTLDKIELLDGRDQPVEWREVQP